VSRWNIPKNCEHQVPKNFVNGHKIKKEDNIKLDLFKRILSSPLEDGDFIDINDEYQNKSFPCDKEN
jgi:hypothetical protein